MEPENSNQIERIFQLLHGEGFFPSPILNLSSSVEYLLALGAFF